MQIDYQELIGAALVLLLALIILKILMKMSGDTIIGSIKKTMKFMSSDTKDL